MICYFEFSMAGYECYYLFETVVFCVDETVSGPFQDRDTLMFGLRFKPIVIKEDKPKFVKENTHEIKIFFPLSFSNYHG